MPYTIVPMLGEDILAQARNQRHRQTGRICPACGADLMRVGITLLVYTYEDCTCDAADYTHLIEQLWHRACLVLQPFDRKSLAAVRRG